jgi:hypothetical protein
MQRLGRSRSPWSRRRRRGQEKYYDLSGSATHLAVVLVSVTRCPGGASSQQVLFALLSVVWMVRLGTFLYLRILRDGRDPRFDEMKKVPLRFLGAWMLQALWVVLVQMPIILISRCRLSDCVRPPRPWLLRRRGSRCAPAQCRGHDARVGTRTERAAAARVDRRLRHRSHRRRPKVRGTASWIDLGNHLAIALTRAANLSCAPSAFVAVPADEGEQGQVHHERFVGARAPSQLLWGGTCQSHL